MDIDRQWNYLAEQDIISLWALKYPAQLAWMKNTDKVFFLKIQKKIYGSL